MPEGHNASTDFNTQNGSVHSITQQISSQAHSATKNSHRKSLDKGDKQEDQHNKHNTDKTNHSDKGDKKFVHTNGTAVPNNDLQFIERIRLDKSLYFLHVHVLNKLVYGNFMSFFHLYKKPYNYHTLSTRCTLKITCIFSRSFRSENF